MVDDGGLADDHTYTFFTKRRTVHELRENKRSPPQDHNCYCQKTLDESGSLHLD